MPEYLWPSATPGVSDTFWDHKNRTPPSVNPGTDITCPYGSNVFATRSGTVTAISSNNNGSGGRYVQVSNDNGTRSQYLHLSVILVGLGQRVGQGQVISLSGASGFGSDWGYGPHCHKSLMIGGVNVDFQNYSSPGGSVPAGGGSTPIDTDESEIEMSTAQILQGQKDWAGYAQAQLAGRMDNQMIPLLKIIAQNVVSNTADLDELLEAVKIPFFQIDPNGRGAAIDVRTGYVKTYANPQDYAEDVRIGLVSGNVQKVTSDKFYSLIEEAVGRRATIMGLTTSVDAGELAAVTA